MELLGLISKNFLSPAILFFVLGIIAGILKSDLKIPCSISKFLAIYLMISIGFKGGNSFILDEGFNNNIIILAIVAVSISYFNPFLAFKLLVRFTNVDKITAAAIAAHYGSVSIVTFTAAVSFLNLNNIAFQSYMISILALMEAPAILSGLYIAHKNSPSPSPNPSSNISKQDKRLPLKEVFTNSAIILLIGSFFIGFITGKEGMEKVESFLITPFNGVLCLFLLDMGLSVVRNSHQLKNFAFSLFLFGIAMPILSALLGLVLSLLLALDKGTSFLFVVLCASSSYIAVPAALRLALPEAKAGIYLPMSLSITFPFNIIVGIPIYYSLVSYAYHIYHT